MASRFYKDVSIGEGPDGYGILLDGRALRTPLGAGLVVPTRAMAEGLAAEWRAQGADIAPHTMPLTRLANSALDHVSGLRDEVAGQILSYGASDLLCYRADGPEELVREQACGWDPLLDWARARFGLDLNVTAGIGHVEQPPGAMAGARAFLSSQDVFMLAGLHALVSLLGSLVLALALVEGRLDPADAFALSRLDEDFQARKWGQDHEAMQRADAQKKDLLSIAAFLGADRG